MKKRKLKAYVMPTLYTMLLVCALLLTITVSNLLVKNEQNNPSQTDEIVSETTEEDTPVINEETNKMLKPYTDEKVTIGKYFYDYKADSTKQEGSIIYHENTYMQNSGVDYILDKEFDVVSVLDGTVTNVSKDDLLGNIVEIKHENNYISIYQSLSSTQVKKGDVVSKGQTIGKSGTNSLDKDMGNHLHFELYIKGQVVDPTSYIDKEIEKTTDNSKNETEKQENNQTNDKNITKEE